MTETVQRRREMLAKTPLFSAIPPSLLDELAIKAKTIRVDTREVLFSKGDPGDRLYLVAKGLIPQTAAELKKQQAAAAALVK